MCKGVGRKISSGWEANEKKTEHLKKTENSTIKPLPGRGEANNKKDRKKFQISIFKLANFDFLAKVCQKNSFYKKDANDKTAISFCHLLQPVISMGAGPYDSLVI